MLSTACYGKQPPDLDCPLCSIVSSAEGGGVKPFCNCPAGQGADFRAFMLSATQDYLPCGAVLEKVSSSQMQDGPTTIIKIHGRRCRQIKGL